MAIYHTTGNTLEVDNPIFRWRTKADKWAINTSDGTCAIHGLSSGTIFF